MRRLERQIALCRTIHAGGVLALRARLVMDELSFVRRRAEDARKLLAVGRHAPGLRLLRQAIGGLARRQAWADAAQGALLLSAELLKRGSPHDALRVLDQGCEHASREGDSGLLLDLAVLRGDGWTDLARLDEAERVLGAALTSARGSGDGRRVQALTVSLARCLFWRGDYAAADALLGCAESERTDSAAAPVVVRRHRLAARIAIALGNSGDALGALERARSVATSEDDRRLRSHVEGTALFVKLVAGDLDGVDRDAAGAVRSARAAHDPLRALSGRLLQAEADRRRGRLVDGNLEALGRLAKKAPPLLKARWELLAALAGYSPNQGKDAKANGVGSDEVAARHASASGLKALALFARSSMISMKDSSMSWWSDGDPLVEDVMAILNLCQHADDELRLLRDVCTRVARRTHAATVAFVVQAAGSSGTYETIACEGPRMETGIGSRAAEAGITIAPHRVRDRIEAAAAVQYAGTAIGALSARWSAGTTDDLSRAPALLLVVAAAAAPLVAAVLAGRAQGSVPAAPDLLGVTPVMVELRRTVERAALAPFAVLIHGETGSGKELVARGIHRLGPRRERPFCTLNCAALPDDLVEAELFGHTRGSFTGAVAARSGVFEEANGGTLFLDEVGELSLRAQAKVLRVLQEGELRRIGENLVRRIDVRIVSATNRDLGREVEAGRFRLDLLYRVDVIRIVVPPLRERRGDLTLLVDHFWADAARRVGSRAMLATATRAALAAYDWPGNVRELQNVLAALAVRSPKRGVVPPTALPPHLAAEPCSEAGRLGAARRTFDETFIRAALARAGGHRGRAAHELGVTRQGLTKLMTRLGIG